MALPLPAPAGPGGDIVDSLKAQNALTESNLKNFYYGPNIESEIANRNALTTGQNIHNQYLPEEYRLANEHAGQVNQFYVPNIKSEIRSRNALTDKTLQMTPLEIEKMKIENQYRAASERARINYQNMGGARGSVAQKDLAAFETQLKLENPQNPEEEPQQYEQRISDLSDAYARGDKTTLNGTPLPPLSWKAQQLQNNVMSRNLPVAAKNQLIQLDQLVNDLKDFDIDAVAEFSGPQGKARLLKAQAQMAINPNDPAIDPMARRYLSSMLQAILNMDQMRKALGTSVVPDYVYKTVGRLTNPNDSIWNDKTQVKKGFNDVVKTMEKNRDMLQQKYRGGILSGSSTGNQKVQMWGRDASGKPVRIS